MTTQQQHLVELIFTVFVLNLFKHSNNPANAMNWLKQTCIILDINQDLMQQMVLSIMSRDLPLPVLVDELAHTLYNTKQGVHVIIKLAVCSRSQVYRRIKRFAAHPIRMQPVFDSDQAYYAAEFLSKFDKIGGVIP